MVESRTIQEAATSCRPFETSPGARVHTLSSADVRIRPAGLFGQWQARNRDSTIHHTITELRRAGNLDNLRAVARPGSVVAGQYGRSGKTPAAYRGRYPFLDTDVFKTLEGIAYEIGRKAADDEAQGFFEEAVTLIESAQQQDGYLNSYFQAPSVDKVAWTDLAWGHELYNLGHLIQAAVAASRQMGDKRLLEVSIRFADLAVKKFGPGGEDAVDGHPEVEMALVELFRETGRREYLELATLFVDRRGRGTVELRVFPAEYFQDDAPFRELDSVTGHAVRMAYLAAGATDVALENHDAVLLAASVRLWADMSRTKLYITGGLGSRHSDEAIGDRYELPSERSYSETCAAIATMQWAWRLFLATGETQYLDGFETVVYNAYAVGLSSDGCAFFYDNPLQRRPDHKQRTGAEPDGEILRRGWFVCPCCPPNIVRWMSELQDHVAAVSSDTLFLAQYTASRISSPVLGVDVDTSYPYEGRVDVSVVDIPVIGVAAGDGTGRDIGADSGQDAPRTGGQSDLRTLAFRIPAWCHSFEAEVNGEAWAIDLSDGWLRIEREWVVGDRVSLRLHMPVRAHVAHPAVDAARGAIAVARGPLVFAAEQQDNKAPLDDVLLSAAHVGSARVVPNDLGGKGDQGTVTLVMPAGRERQDPDLPLYPELELTRPVSADLPAPLGVRYAPPEPTELTLVPYHLWGNRDPLTMRVWLRRDTMPVPFPTDALRASPNESRNP